MFKGMQKIWVGICLSILIAPSAFAWEPAEGFDIWFSVSQWVAEAFEEIQEGIGDVWVEIFESETDPPPLPGGDDDPATSSSDPPPPPPGPEDDDDGSNFGGGQDPFG